MEKEKGKKKGTISERDVWLILDRYSSATILALLKEVSQFHGAKKDWKALVRSSSTGITSPREYQMLWRHLAYRETLLDKLEDGAEPLEDDSDLEFEVDAVPAITREDSLEASACVEVLISSRMERPTCPVSHSTVKDPFTMNITANQTSCIPTDKKPPRPPRLDAMDPVSKHLLQTGPSSYPDETGQPSSTATSKKRRIPWTPEEDMDLKACVEKCGEGNWASILRGDFKHNRTASQLAQRWSIIKKRETNITPGSSKRSRSAECLATNKACSLALDMPMTGSIAKSYSGAQPCSSTFSAARPPLYPNPSQHASTLKTSQNVVSIPSKKPRTARKHDDPVMPSASPLASSTCPNSSIQEVAFAAGGRIAAPSAAASLLKAAQSRSAVHIIPAGGQSLPRTNMLPRNVQPVVNLPVASPRGGAWQSGGWAGRPVTASPVMKSCQSPQLETKTQKSTGTQMNRIISTKHADGMESRCTMSQGDKKGVRSLYRDSAGNVAGTGQADLGGNTNNLNSGTISDHRRTGNYKPEVIDASTIQLPSVGGSKVNAVGERFKSLWRDVPILDAQHGAENGPFVAKPPR